MTAFSAFEDYGIRLLTVRYYYTLPKRKLSAKDVFVHSLHVYEKEPDARNFIFVALFYLKFKNKLGKIKDPLLENIKSVLAGNNIENYPKKSEIIDRARVYGIENGDQ